MVCEQDIDQSLSATEHLGRLVGAMQGAYRALRPGSSLVVLVQGARMWSRTKALATHIQEVGVCLAFLHYNGYYRIGPADGPGHTSWLVLIFTRF
jgi:energy-converting hydrogenase Eha subunit E